VAASDRRLAYLASPGGPVAVPVAAAGSCSALGAGRPYGTGAHRCKAPRSPNGATCGKWGRAGRRCGAA